MLTLRECLKEDVLEKCDSNMVCVCVYVCMCVCVYVCVCVCMCIRYG